MTDGRRPAPLSDVFSALADPTRRRVVDLLARAPLRASELAHQVGASRPAMSRHLRILRAAGVVREESDGDDGRARLLALERAPFDAVRAWCDELEDFWSAQLESFRTLAEARAAELAQGKPGRARRRAS